MKHFFVLLVFFSFLSGCDKGKAEFTLEGAIEDGTFGGFLEGAKVTLYEVTNSGSDLTKIADQTTTENGRYSFTFQRNIVESYYITVEKTNYFTVESTLPFSDLSVENPNVKPLSTTAKSWAKLRFINDAPQPGDQLKYIKNEGKSNCEACCSDAEQFLVGAIDTTIYCINDGNTNYAYNYWLIGGGLSGNKSAVTTAFDTVEIVLNY